MLDFGMGSEHPGPGICDDPDTGRSQRMADEVRREDRLQGRQVPSIECLLHAQADSPGVMRFNCHRPASNS